MSHFYSDTLSRNSLLVNRGVGRKRLYINNLRTQPLPSRMWESKGFRILHNLKCKFN